MIGLTWIEVSGTALLAIEPALGAPMVQSLSGSEFVNSVTSGFVGGPILDSIAFPGCVSLTLVGPSVSEASDADEGDTNESPVIRRVG